VRMQDAVGHTKAGVLNSGSCVGPRLCHNALVCCFSLQKPRPAPCDCCEGSGSRNCGYCNSTGVPHSAPQHQSTAPASCAALLLVRCCTISGVYAVQLPQVADGIQTADSAMSSILHHRINVRMYFLCSSGAMMVGHERFCSLEQGCKPCPICNGTVRSAASMS
jgi:hypothetical protein